MSTYFILFLNIFLKIVAQIEQRSTTMPIKQWVEYITHELLQRVGKPPSKPVVLSLYVMNLKKGKGFDCMIVMS